MSVRQDRLADEMVDSREDLAAPRPLGEFLGACSEQLRRPYDEADRSAQRFQTCYRWLILAAAFFTTLTLFVEILSLVFRGGPPDWAPRITRILGYVDHLGVEASLAAVSSVLVIIGYFLQRNWLLRRHQAERYRLLKFHLLIDPSLWGCGPAKNWEAELGEKVQEIRQLEHDDLADEAAKEDVAQISSADVCSAADHGDVTRLLDYYKRRRLGLQRDYFKRAARKARSIWLNPLWVPGIFFGAMGMIFLRFWLDWAQIVDHTEHKETSELLGVVALLLPAVLVALRLRVTANELARNRNRSLARNSALEQIAVRLGGVDETRLLRITDTVQEMPQAPQHLRVSIKIEGPVDPAYVFSNLALAEQILSLDEHEWLRLMLEAEWYR